MPESKRCTHVTSWETLTFCDAKVWRKCENFCIFHLSPDPIPIKDVKTFFIDCSKNY